MPKWADDQDPRDKGDDGNLGQLLNGPTFTEYAAGKAERPEDGHDTGGDEESLQHIRAPGSAFALGFTRSVQ